MFYNARRYEIYLEAFKVKVLDRLLSKETPILLY